MRVDTTFDDSYGRSSSVIFARALSAQGDVTLLLGDLKLSPQTTVFFFKRPLVLLTRKRLLRIGGKRLTPASYRPLVQAKISFHLPVRHPIRIYQPTRFTFERSIYCVLSSDDSRELTGTHPDRT